jgi:hypothetical protein
MGYIMVTQYMYAMCVIKSVNAHFHLFNHYSFFLAANVILVSSSYLEIYNHYFIAYLLLYNHWLVYLPSQLNS